VGLKTHWAGKHQTNQAMLVLFWLESWLISDPYFALKCSLHWFKFNGNSTLVIICDDKHTIGDIMK